MRLTLLLLALLTTIDAAPRKWETDWNTAFKVAKQQHRLVFVNYTASWCGECHDVEMITFRSLELMENYSDFIMLRVDVDRSEIPAEYRRKDLPAYLVFDPDGRERFQIVGKGAGSSLTEKSIGEIRRAAPNFVKAAELLDTKHELEASFLIANTYSSLKMGSRARDSYAEARNIARRNGDRAAAQTAEVQSAFTYARTGDPHRAVILLTSLAKQPVNADVEALTWLLLGRSHEAAGEKASALASYEHAQSLAPRESRTFAEAAEAGARLKP
jgi:tetratricopeptide (TPR) repeat protein